LRPLWLNGEAVQLAEHCAEAAAMPAARFVESMLFELCGASTQVKKSARGVKKREVHAPGRVISICKARRWGGVN
jgi:hypothetical protein